MRARPAGVRAKQPDESNTGCCLVLAGLAVAFRIQNLQKSCHKSEDNVLWTMSSLIGQYRSDTKRDVQVLVFRHR
jgi:hypothetical protein